MSNAFDDPTNETSIRTLLSRDADEYAALMLASKNGDTSTITLLLGLLNEEDRHSTILRLNANGESAITVAKGTSTLACLLHYVDALTTNPTPLLLACRHPDCSIHLIKSFIESHPIRHRQSYILCEDEDQRTALIEASKNGFSEVVACLLSYLDMEARSHYILHQDKEGFSALRLSLLGDDSIFRALLDSLDPDFQIYVLKQAGLDILQLCGIGNYQELIIKAFVDCLDLVRRPDLLSILYQHDEPGDTLLHHATRTSNLSIISSVLEPLSKEARLTYLSLQNKNGMTALMNACKHAHVVIVNYLLDLLQEYTRLERQRILTQRNVGQKNVLYYACVSDISVKHILGLLDAADRKKYILQEFTLGTTALTTACYFGHTSTVTVLLESLHAACRASYILHQPESGRSALLVACERGHAAIVEVLLRCLGEDERQECILQRDESGNTALTLASIIESGYLPVSEALMNALDPAHRVLYVLNAPDFEAGAMFHAHRLRRTALLQYLVTMLANAPPTTEERGYITVMITEALARFDHPTMILQILQILPPGGTFPRSAFEQYCASVLYNGTKHIATAMHIFSMMCMRLPDSAKSEFKLMIAKQSPCTTVTRTLLTGWLRVLSVLCEYPTLRDQVCVKQGTSAFDIGAGNHSRHANMDMDMTMDMGMGMGTALNWAVGMDMDMDMGMGAGEGVDGVLKLRTALIRFLADWVRCHPLEPGKTPNFSAPALSSPNHRHAVADHASPAKKTIKKPSRRVVPKRYVQNIFWGDLGNILEIFRLPFLLELLSAIHCHPAMVSASVSSNIYLQHILHHPSSSSAMAAASGSVSSPIAISDTSAPSSPVALPFGSP